MFFICLVEVDFLVIFVCRNYYLYEFGRDDERIALVAAVNRGRVSAANSNYSLRFILPYSYDSLNHFVFLKRFL